MRGNFESIIRENRPVVIDFHATWCGPCKIQSPILKEVSDAMGEKVRIIKIDVDQNYEIARRFQIQSVPTIVIVKNGELKYRQSGVHTKTQLVNILHQNID